jgi:hypothetical protein
MNLESGKQYTIRNYKSENVLTSFKTKDRVGLLKMIDKLSLLKEVAEDSADFERLVEKVLQENLGVDLVFNNVLIEEETPSTEEIETIPLSEEIISEEELNNNG